MLKPMLPYEKSGHARADLGLQALPQRSSKSMLAGFKDRVLHPLAVTFIFLAQGMGSTFAAEPDSTTRPLWTTSRLRGTPEPPPPYVVEKVFPRLALQNPIYIAPEPGTDRLFVVDLGSEDPKPWQIRRFQNSPDVNSAALLMSVTNRQIYGLTFHPGYESNRFLYVFNNGPWNQASRSNRISRFTVPRDDSQRIDPASEQIIIEWLSAGHDGGDLWFGKDGMLYITSGDGTSDSDTWDSGQDMTRLLAKLLRIDVNRTEGNRAYAVPADNPFVNTPGVRPETWAYGFRNPWRMGIDPRNGDIWVGQNGQDLWESAALVQKGVNYGWSIYEGSHPFNPHRKRGPTPIVAPLIEHSHADFRSLTGGVVYYGDPLPDLNGVYVYGDYSTGKIWGARHRHGKLTWNRELADTTLQIAAFRVDQSGRLLIVDHAGALYQLKPRPASGPRPKFPTKLSETGLFSSIEKLSPSPGVIPYDVNAPAWTDGAHAQRWLAIPGTNTIAFAPSRGWNFAHGSVIAQTLTLGFVSTQPPIPRRVETRVLLREDGEWVGYSYRWNEKQTEAHLVEKSGQDLTLKFRDESGALQTQAWRIPSRAECMACHARAVNYTLGLSLVQMNRTNSFHRPGENQIAALARLGILQGAPSKPEPSTSALVNPYDHREDLSARARSYLHANCSVCHVEAGGGNARMELEFTREESKMNLIGSRPQHDTFGIPDAAVVAAGAPEKSILLHRLSRRGKGQMPPLVSARVDTQAVALMKEWIQSLTPEFQFVREWNLKDFESSLSATPPYGNASRGKVLFEKIGCAQCHRVNGSGGAVGPDLTGLGNRQSPIQILESILDPSKSVADDFASYELELRDGETVTGRVERESSDAWFLRTGSAMEELVRIPKSHVKRKAKSSLSNMPAGIINVFQQDQVLDLVSFLLDPGNGHGLGRDPGKD
ncbi:MAG: c-type cytochrome [Verrucomicrobia bacterium]|nr:c-type cytochrome [Verrucomicrobiota bacterium]